MRSRPPTRPTRCASETDRGDRVTLTSSSLEAATSLTRMPSLESRAGSFVGFEPGLDRFLEIYGRSAQAECGMESDVARQSARSHIYRRVVGAMRTSLTVQRLTVDGFG